MAQAADDQEPVLRLLADPATFGGANGLVINPPTPPSWLGASFSLEHWEAWIACAGALVVLFVLYNLMHSGLGRSLRAVRDDEIAASLCGFLGPSCGDGSDSGLPWSSPSVTTAVISALPVNDVPAGGAGMSPQRP